MRIVSICKTHLGSHGKSVWLALLLMIVQTGLNLLVPWPLKVVFDNVLGRHALQGPWRALFATLSLGTSQTRLGLLGTMIVVMLAIALVRALFTFWSGMLTASVGLSVVYRIRLQLFDHLQRLSLAYHKGSRSGDLSARLTSDIQAVQDVVSSGLNGLITNSLTVVGIMVIAAVIDWRFALLMACAAPLLLFVANSYQKSIRKGARWLRDAEGQVSATTQERLNAIQVVQAFAQEDHETRGFARQADQSLHAGLTVARLQAELTPLIDLVGVVGLAAVTWLGGREVLSGHITPGYLLVFITYFRSILSPIRQLAKLSSRFSKAEASAERIEDILTLELEVRDYPGAHAAPRVQGAVTFEDVSFSYRENAPALQHISVQVEPGMTVALVGPTGSGKSTLLGLIPRFYDPRGGRVLIDGVDLRDYTLASVRKQISIVLQEPVLFAGTIRENIAYGRDGATDDDVVRAARAVGIHDLLMRLPRGYDTVVGERGATLSGGQRQLISVARVLTRDAPILILDEPTTGLDAGSEATLLRALDRLMRGRTTFVSTHQLRTIERADLILVINRGQIHERGTHQELMRAGGLYAHWHSLQRPDSPDDLLWSSRPIVSDLAYPSSAPGRVMTSVRTEV